MFAAAVVAALVGPLVLLAVLATGVPGPAPRRRALRTAALGLGIATLLAVVTRGQLGFTLLVLACGAIVVAPLYLVVFAWIARASATGKSLLESRSGIELAVVLGIATWSAPLGLAAHRADVAWSKHYIERLAERLEAERARTGHYPPHEDLEAHCEFVGWRPPSLLGGIHYYAWEDHVELGFVDRTAFIGMYCWHGKERGWERWSD